MAPVTIQLQSFFCAFREERVKGGHQALGRKISTYFMDWMRFQVGMSDIGFFADIRYAILSNSKFSIPISADTDVDIWVIFPQT